MTSAPPIEPAGVKGRSRARAVAQRASLEAARTMGNPALYMSGCLLDVLDQLVADHGW
jgi:hypothetical protein